MMRKLISKEEEERKHKRNQWILGISLVVVMFGSVFGVIVGSFGSDENGEEKSNLKYKDFNILTEYPYYFIEFESKIYFSTNLTDVYKIEKEINISKTFSDFAGEKIYFSTEYTQELGPLLRTFYKKSQLIPATLDENISIQEDIPQITNCDKLFIGIKESKYARIYEEENCIYIEGKKEDLKILVDELSLQISGIK